MPEISILFSVCVRVGLQYIGVLFLISILFSVCVRTSVAADTYSSGYFYLIQCLCKLQCVRFLLLNAHFYLIQCLCKVVVCECVTVQDCHFYLIQCLCKWCVLWGLSGVLWRFQQSDFNRPAITPKPHLIDYSHTKTNKSVCI